MHVQERPVGPANVLLLCTDGLHGSLPTTASRRAGARPTSMERTADALVRAALERGCRDNVTALVVASARQ